MTNSLDIIFMFNKLNKDKTLLILIYLNDIYIYLNVTIIILFLNEFILKICFLRIL